MLGDIVIEKHKFHQHKSPFSISDVNINKLIEPNKAPFVQKGYRYFISCNNDGTVKTLCLMLPKVSACKKAFDETKYMSFLIKYDKSRGKYNKICDKVSSSMRKTLK